MRREDGFVNSFDMQMEPGQFDEILSGKSDVTVLGRTHLVARDVFIIREFGKEYTGRKIEVAVTSIDPEPGGFVGRDGITRGFVPVTTIQIKIIQQVA